MRTAFFGLIVGALLGAPLAVWAQTAEQSTGQPTGQIPDQTLDARANGATAQALPYRILNQDVLFRESRLGQQILAEIRAAEQALEAENQLIFDQLSAEERALTDQRATLPPDEFRALADAFDARVEEIRAERAARAQELTEQSEAEAQRFFDRALPVLFELMNDEGIVALLRPEALVLGVDAINVTPLAIERLDAATAQQTSQP